MVITRFTTGRADQQSIRVSSTNSTRAFAAAVRLSRRDEHWTDELAEELAAAGWLTPGPPLEPFPDFLEPAQ